MHDIVTLVIFVTLFLALPIYSESATECLDLQHHGECVNVKRSPDFMPYYVSGLTNTASTNTASVTLWLFPSQDSSTTSLTLDATSSSTSLVFDSTGVSSPPQNTASSIPASAATQTHGNPTSNSTSSSTPLPKSGVSKRGPMVTVGIVIGSCVAGIAIFWTVFRRWKFRRQSDGRLQVHPMDLPPTNAEGTGQHRFTTGGSFHPSNVVASPRSFKLGASSGQSGSGADHNRESTGGSSMSEHSWHSYRLSQANHGFSAGPTILEPASRSSVQTPLMHQIDIMRDPSISSMTSLPPSYDVAVLLHNY
jgi:hypothetical protein